MAYIYISQGALRTDIASRYPLQISSVAHRITSPHFDCRVVPELEKQPWNHILGEHACFDPKKVTFIFTFEKTIFCKSFVIRHIDLGPAFADMNMQPQPKDSAISCIFCNMSANTLLWHTKRSSCSPRSFLNSSDCSLTSSCLKSWCWKPGDNAHIRLFTGFGDSAHGTHCQLS